MDEIDEVEVRNAHRGLARVLREYYVMLLEEGFTVEQAFELVRSRQYDLTSG